jgi:hypothetical protein
MLSSRTPLDQKQTLLNQLQNLRVNMNNRAERSSAFADFLDILLLQIDTVEGNIWATKRLPIPLPSFRLKLGSAKRLLRTLENEENKSRMLMNEETAAEVAPRRRRALMVLLSQLSRQKGGIRGVEAEAFRRMSLTSMREMLERTPAGLETPKYDVVDSRRTWEVRKYEPFSVCSTVMEAQQQDGPMGFNSLAGYIFGKNEESYKMAMTTPVISSANVVLGATTPSQSSTSKKMSFIMPSAYWSALDTAPKPLPNSGVQLETGALAKSSDTIAVVWFGGYATKEEVAMRTLELLEMVDSDEKWSVVEGEEVRLMQYNDPFQPFWKRRNEVCIPVVPMLQY